MTTLLLLHLPHCDGFDREPNDPTVALRAQHVSDLTASFMSVAMAILSWISSSLWWQCNAPAAKVVESQWALHHAEGLVEGTKHNQRVDNANAYDDVEHEVGLLLVGQALADGAARVNQKRLGALITCHLQNALRHVDIGAITSFDSRDDGIPC